ncbi:MAG: FAD-dependent oxidoreductase [Lachnospiraceae bacterium]|nr:FAD-dependent oxidoreductase [Lachnospiraceae bacterium]
MKIYDVIIIGSGLVGVSTAYELSKAGRKVALLDAGGLSAGASAGNTGLLLFEDETSGTAFDLCVDSLRIYKDLDRELEMDFGFGPMNFLGFFCREEERETALRKQAIYQRNGFDFELLDAAELRKKEPRLCLEKELGGAYYRQWIMDPLRLVFAYFRKALLCGTEWFSHEKVVDFIREGSHVRGVITEKGTCLYGDNVVAATGAWTGNLLRKLDVTLKQYYIQGACMVMERSREVLRHTISTFTSPRITMQEAAAEILRETDWADFPEQNADEFIIVPDTNGNHLVAQRSCVSRRDIDKVPQEYLRDMAANVCRYLPSLKHQRIIRSWITPVPFVEDKKPFWGRLEAYPEVIAASGFESVLIMAPAIGRVTGRMVMGEPAGYDLTGCDPNRTF